MVITTIFIMVYTNNTVIIIITAIIVNVCCHHYTVVSELLISGVCFGTGGKKNGQPVPFKITEILFLFRSFLHA